MVTVPSRDTLIRPVLLVHKRTFKFEFVYYTFLTKNTESVDVTHYALVPDKLWVGRKNVELTRELIDAEVMFEAVEEDTKSKKKILIPKIVGGEQPKFTDHKHLFK